MLLAIPSVLDAAQVAEARAIVEAGEWRDGKVTAGIQSALAKNNLQLVNDSEEARRIGQVIVDALASNALFQSAARAWRPSSGSNPWFVRIRSVRCCWTWTPRFGRWRRKLETTMLQSSR